MIEIDPGIAALSSGAPTLETIHILRKDIFRIFGPPPFLRKFVFSTENKQKLAFSDPLQVLT